jgi:hypothetical protein
MSAIAESAANLANAARIGVDLAGVDKAHALDAVCRDAVSIAHKARTRDGFFAREFTTAQLEPYLFQGSVAADILDGTVERPSVGNVRQYALDLV